jgi:hypothetical protein
MARLRDANKRDRVCAETEESTQRLAPCWEGDYASCLGLENLNLEYVPYVVRIPLAVEKGKKAESKDAELLLAQGIVTAGASASGTPSWAYDLARSLCSAARVFRGCLTCLGLELRRVSQDILGDTLDFSTVFLRRHQSGL